MAHSPKKWVVIEWSTTTDNKAPEGNNVLIFENINLIHQQHQLKLILKLVFRFNVILLFNLYSKTLNDQISIQNCCGGQFSSFFR